MRLFVQRTADLMGADGEAVLADVELSDTVTRLEMARLMYGLVDDIDDDVRHQPHRTARSSSMPTTTCLGRGERLLC